MAAKIILLSGTSGVGKTPLVKSFIAQHPYKKIGIPVLFTSRTLRPVETDGVDYFFVSQGEFADMIENDELLEYAVVYGDYKGIPKQQVRQALASGKDVIMRIDPRYFRPAAPGSTFSQRRATSASLSGSAI